MVSVVELLVEFEDQRSKLFGLAYRLLGSAEEADDVVQDAFIRWSGVDRAAIVAPSSWLAKVVTNLCLNRLTAARVQRERYVGPWLPEPVLTEDGALGPLETAEMRDSLSLGVLVLLERLTPVERAVFVLREAFGYHHREIADILYRAKLEAERLIEHSGLPYTIMRVTQFHDVVRTLLAAAAKAPAMLVPDLRFQPVDVGEVATRLTELALGEPVAHAPDFAGPQVRDARELARAYLRATGRRHPILPVRLPGTVFRAYRRGGNLAPEHAAGKITFAEYLTRHADPTRVSYRGRPW